MSSRFMPASRKKGGVVYKGLIWTAGEPGGDEDFGPLYDFGQAAWGCVEIQYREGGRWVSL